MRSTPKQYKNQLFQNQRFFVSTKGNVVSTKGNVVSDKGNVLSPKGNSESKGQPFDLAVISQWGPDIKTCTQAASTQRLRKNGERAGRRTNRRSRRVIMLYGLYDWTKLIRMVCRQNMFPSVATTFYLKEMCPKRPIAPPACKNLFTVKNQGRAWTHKVQCCFTLRYMSEVLARGVKMEKNYNLWEKVRAIVLFCIRYRTNSLL